MCFPMMMYPGQNQGTPIMVHMQMPTQSGQQQPMICMMPDCFMGPSKLPKDLKFLFHSEQTPPSLTKPGGVTLDYGADVF